MEIPEQSLQSVEMQSLDDDPTIVGDLTVGSVCDCSLLFPIFFFIVVVAIGFLLPPKHEIQKLTQRIAKDDNPLQIETELSDIVKHHGYVALNLRFEGCEQDIFSVPISATLSFYRNSKLVSTGTSEISHFFEVEEVSRESDPACLFKSTYIDFDEVRGRFTIEKKPQACKYTLLWVHGHPRTLFFLYSVRFACAIASIPYIISALRKANRFWRLRFEFQATYALFFAILISFNPFAAIQALVPIPYAYLMSCLGFALAVSIIVWHSLCVLGSLVPERNMIVPHLFSGMILLYYILKALRNEINADRSITPAVGIPEPVDRVGIVITAVYGVLFIAYLVIACKGSGPSMRNRLIWYIIVIVPTYLSCIGFIVLSIVQNPIVSSAVYSVWPMLACYMYVWLMAYVHIETDDGAVALYQPGVKGDNEIGVDSL